MKLELRLYVVAQTPSAIAAINTINKIIHDQKRNNWHVDIIDVVSSPQLVEEDRIVAVPALVRKHPQPMKRYVGDFSDINYVLQSFESEMSGDSEI